MKHTKSYRSKHLTGAKTHTRLTFLRMNVVWNLAILALVVLGASTIYVSIMYAVRGSELVRIEKQLSQIEAENSRLAREMLAEMSLISLSQEAEELGMLQPVNIIYLNQETGLALLP